MDRGCGVKKFISADCKSAPSGNDFLVTMVTKLKNNKIYIEYIQARMKKVLPKWEVVSVVFEGEINNNFQTDFRHLNKKMSLVKDKGLLELNFYINDKSVDLGNLIYDSILNEIPEQDPKWRLSLCVELIDFYIEFIKQLEKKYMKEL